jgi:hypothetical protein
MVPWDKFLRGYKEWLDADITEQLEKDLKYVLGAFP